MLLMKIYFQTMLVMQDTKNSLYICCLIRFGKKLRRYGLEIKFTSVTYGTNQRGWETSQNDGFILKCLAPPWHQNGLRVEVNLQSQVT